MSQVVDGLSNTIFLGERRVECSVHGLEGWSGSNGHGMGCTLIPINYDSCHPEGSGPPYDDPCQWLTNWTTELGFKSRHPGGAQMLLGDGAVRFFSETIDHWNYQRLGDKAAGTVVIVAD